MVPIESLILRSASCRVCDSLGVPCLTRQGDLPVQLPFGPEVGVYPPPGVVNAREAIANAGLLMLFRDDVDGEPICGDCYDERRDSAEVLLTSIDNAEAGDTPQHVLHAIVGGAPSVWSLFSADGRHRYVQVGYTGASNEEDKRLSTEDVMRWAQSAVSPEWTGLPEGWRLLRGRMRDEDRRAARWLLETGRVQ